MPVGNYQYDLIVIGSGPAGLKGAMQAAKLGKRVALVEKAGVGGGAPTGLGTIPSKTLREAIVYLSGLRQRGVYGESYSLKQNIRMEDLRRRYEHVVASEADVRRSQL